MGELIFVLTGLVLIALEEYVFTQTRFFWLGGLLPLVGTVLVLFIVFKGFTTFTLRDFITAAIAIVVLYVFWGNGHTHYQKKVKDEEKKMKIKDIK
ncbi:hypothetical protein [Loigolactobacillus zhaoyuanensis]|uniref:Uncharacterized protein n=1 Tax=Loigolactobacillus zhaoyuanensis TaxID=2486017 RepID=A0ABW8UE74_9LACO